MKLFSLILIAIAILTQQVCSTNETRTTFSCPEDGFDFYDHDIGYAIPDVPSWENCGKICGLVSSCIAWTWEKQYKYCDLKSSTDGARVSTCCISGMKDCQG